MANTRSRLARATGQEASEATETCDDKLNENAAGRACARGPREVQLSNQKEVDAPSLAVIVVIERRSGTRFLYVLQRVSAVGHPHQSTSDGSMLSRVCPHW
jgi:hypothetical protein